MKHYLTANASFGDYRADSDSLCESPKNATRGNRKLHTRNLATGHKDFGNSTRAYNTRSGSSPEKV